MSIDDFAGGVHGQYDDIATNPKKYLFCGEPNPFYQEEESQADGDNDVLQSGIDNIVDFRKWIKHE